MIRYEERGIRKAEVLQTLPLPAPLKVETIQSSEQPRPLVPTTSQSECSKYLTTRQSSNVRLQGYCKGRMASEWQGRQVQRVMAGRLQGNRSSGRGKYSTIALLQFFAPLPRVLEIYMSYPYRALSTLPTTDFFCSLLLAPYSSTPKSCCSRKSADSPII